VMFAGKGDVSVIRAVSNCSSGRCISIRNIVSDWVLLCGIVAPCVLHAAGEEDYLRAIELETEKLNRQGSVTTANSGMGSSRRMGKRNTKPSGKSLRSGLSMEGFEQQLSDSYTGSAVFYHKLSRRSQEEIYGRYQEGASLPDLRSTIMNRFLNRE